MRRDAALAFVLAGALVPAAAAAQACGAPVAPTITPGEGHVWPAPLDRPIIAPARDDAPAPVTLAPVTLARALDQLASAANVRFSYSPELLPVERLTCVPAGRVVLGDALRVVLMGTGIVPVIAGRDQVVLAPERNSANADAAPELARTLGRLERVVVTGTATGGTERASPFALNVIEGAALERAGTRTVAQLLDGAVPGLWMWTQSPTSLTARYGSVRGASSFEATSPKVYIDGIELANPLLLSQLDASRVQRIEVIRGPQGAALYGTDAISGVVNVVMRQEGATDGPRAELRAGAGTAGSAYASPSALAQEHAFTLGTGAAGRTANLATSLTTMGDYLPGAASRQLSLTGGARHVGARLAVTGTARYQDASTEPVASPLVDSASSLLVSDAAQRLRQYTLGVNVALQPSERWTHALVAGIDGYHQRGLVSESLPVLPMADSLPGGVRGNGQRITLRANSTRRAVGDSAHAASLTLGLEQSFSREQGNDDAFGYAPPPAGRRDAGGAIDPRGSSVLPWRSTGVFTQGQAAWHNALFVQGGARVEYISGLTQSAQVALLPMLGGAWVREYGPTSLKLRGAYGRGIRPARLEGRGGMGTPLFGIDPEQQSGVEWGADLLWDAPGDARVSLQATRFDQLASNLAQLAARLNDSTCYQPRSPNAGSGGIHADMMPSGGCSRARRGYYFTAENVGRIENDGWEMQASLVRGPLALSSSLALVDSRVRRLAARYGGDLREGDRMLEVPARTSGVSASWSATRWTLALTAARASDWRNYDRIALAAAVVRSTADTTGTTALPTGAALRPYVRDYAGVTRLGARMDFTLWRATALTLRGDNLLGRQLGEPDNVTVLPGRTLIVGIRTGF